MRHLGTILTVVLALYALAMAVFIVSENRRPQSTLAWMLALVIAPGIALLIYVLFRRDRKAFSKQSRLLRQDLEANALPLLSPILSRQDSEIARLERGSRSRRKLMMLVRRNSYSALTRRNRVDILQDAARFYPSLVEDMKAARHSIHLQYFTWRADAFTEGVKDVLIAKAKAGVEVRLLYDPIGSPGLGAHVRQMKAAGVRTAPTSHPYQLHTISYRNHRKISVIDGAIGYVGGMNIGQEHLDGGKGFHSWRDTQHSGRRKAPPGGCSGGRWPGSCSSTRWRGWSPAGSSGRGAGLLSGALADYGINDQFIRDVGATLTPGSSALFLLLRRVNADRVLPEMAKHNPKVLRTSLTSEQEAKLRAALEQGTKGRKAA